MKSGRCRPSNLEGMAEGVIGNLRCAIHLCAISRRLAAEPGCIGSPKAFNFLEVDRDEPMLA
jgi:hypothetical protein